MKIIYKTSKLQRDQSKLYRQLNPEKRRETVKKYQLTHPGKVKEINKRWYIKNREKISIKAREYTKSGKRNISTRKSRYGLTQKDFDNLKKNQSNLCAICLIEFEITPRIDHCHRTNKIRGLLCNQCNIGLGAFKDKIEVLKSAIIYLRRAA